MLEWCTASDTEGDPLLRPVETDGIGTRGDDEPPGRIERRVSHRPGSRCRRPAPTDRVAQGLGADGQVAALSERLPAVQAQREATWHAIRTASCVCCHDMSRLHKLWSPEGNTHAA